MKKRGAYSELRITLPTFVILTLRTMVSESNASRASSEQWTLSLLMERWLMEELTLDNLIATAQAHPDAFKDSANAWLQRKLRSRAKAK